MKTSFLTGHSDLVAGWAGKLLKVRDFGKCEATGIIKDDKIIAAIIYNNFFLDYENKPISIEISIASVDKAWCTRHNLNALFAYPFIQLNVKRLQATCPEGNSDTRSFLKRLGFHLEGIAREANHLGGNSSVYSMLKHECKWIEENEQIRQLCARP